jgi:hypothetical protein
MVGRASRHRPRVIGGSKRKALLDDLKGPITKVGDLVRKAKADQEKK